MLGLPPPPAQLVLRSREVDGGHLQLVFGSAADGRRGGVRGVIGAREKGDVEAWAKLPSAVEEASGDVLVASPGFGCVARVGMFGGERSVRLGGCA